MAMKTHPDRGGTQEQFQQVSIAYSVLLKKLKDINNSNLHNDLRHQSRQYMETQSQESIQNVNLTDMSSNLNKTSYILNLSITQLTLS